MTAPDPRLEEIEGRLEAADAVGIEWSALPALTDDKVIMFQVYDDEGHCIAECSDMAVANLAGHAPADIAYLLAELRKAQDGLSAVDKLLTEKYKLWAAICGNTCSNDILGVDHDAIADEVAAAIRAAVADATGGGE